VDGADQREGFDIRPLPIRDIRGIRGSSSFGCGWAALGFICGFCRILGDYLLLPA
jgi:hypothetical protein